MIDDLDPFPLTVHGKPYRGFVTRPEGKPLLLIHELPGLNPYTIAFARRLRDRGFRVYMPVMFGTPGKTNGTLRNILIGLSPRTKAFSRTRISPRIEIAKAAVDAIAQRIDPKQQIGVIGMCMTGSWGIVLLPHPRVGAAVCSQPSLPFGFTDSFKRALGVSDAEIAAARATGKPMLSFRFTTDPMCPTPRWDRLASEFGRQIEMHSIPTGGPWEIKSDAHAVLTKEYKPDPGHPTNDAFLRVVEFFRTAL